jgi:hypothetical protein
MAFLRIGRVLLISSLSLAALAQNNRSEPLPAMAAEAPSDLLPTTTSSPRARQLFDQAMVDFGDQQFDHAMKGLRAAVKEDPNFALAHILISFYTKNPAEESNGRRKAKALAAHVTPGERLMVRWIAAVQEDDYVTGIAAMNDLRHVPEGQACSLSGRILALLAGKL